jgi:hypothetical protein
LHNISKKISPEKVLLFITLLLGQNFTPGFPVKGPKFAVSFTHVVAPYLKYYYSPQSFFHFHCIFSRGIRLSSVRKATEDDGFDTQGSIPERLLLILRNHAADGLGIHKSSVQWPDRETDRMSKFTDRSVPLLAV